MNKLSGSLRYFLRNNIILWSLLLLSSLLMIYFVSNYNAYTYTDNNISDFYTQTTNVNIGTRKSNSPENDVSCHDNKEHILPCVEDVNFSPPERSIYFIETSCKGSFNSRQACSIESAVRANPQLQVYVLLAGPLNNDFVHEKLFLTLKTMPNLNFFRIHPKNYSRGTILESFFEQHFLEPSPYRVSHCSDALRMLTLNKYGGIYLDLDVLVVKSFATLPDNFVSKETKTSLASCVLGISKYGIGKEFSDTALSDLNKSYTPSQWSYNGPALILRTLESICKKESIEEMTPVACQGFHIFDAKYFCPIHYSMKNVYFSDKSINIEDEYMHHIWNHLTSHEVVKKDSFYGMLAKRFCPLVFALYEDKFGL